MTKKDKKKTVINNLTGRTMRKKNLFMYALASIVMFGCSQSNLADDDSGGNSGGVKGEEAWIVLNIQKTVSGRSLNSTDKHDGTTDESNVKTVKAIFFNGFSDASTVSDIVDLKMDNSGNAGTPTANDAFKINTKSKSVLIVINPTATLNAVTKGTSYNVVNKITAASVDDVTKENGAGDQNYFLMTNSKGGLEPSEMNGTDKDISNYLHETKKAAETATPLTIKVDRVVSKVRVDAATATSDVATISDIEWTLNITNRKFFPVSKRQYSWFDTEKRTDATRVWSDQYFLGSYRIDPNYDNSLNPWSNQTLYNAEYDYYTDFTANTINWIKADITIDSDDPGQNSPKHAYCLENTQKKEGNYYAYTTHALLKAKFLPKKYAMPSGAADDTGQETSEDWMSVNDGFYRYTTLLAWIETELTNKYSNVANIDKYETKITTAFHTYLSGLGGGITAPTIMDKAAFELSGKTALEVVAETKQAFKDLQADVEAATNKSSASTANVKYYTGGLNYYQIMIKHDDSDEVSNELGEFGVVRNALYDITVSKIDNPGTPTIPDPDPNTPDEAKNWLKVKIEINPWTWYKQTEIL